MSSPGPYATKWERVRQHLEGEIADGMTAHTVLPSERELMARFGVSRMTVRQALARLEDDGLVYRTQGAGTFVADPRTIDKGLVLTSFSEDVRQRGMQPGSRQVSCERQLAEPSVARDLAIDIGSAVVRLQRVRTADGVPLCLETVWLPVGVVGDALDAGVDGSLYELLAARDHAPQRAEQTIGAALFEARDAALLDLAAGSAALVVSRVTYDRHRRAVERAETAYRADRYFFHVSVTRRQR